MKKILFCLAIAGLAACGNDDKPTSSGVDLPDYTQATWEVDADHLLNVLIQQMSDQVIDGSPTASKCGEMMDFANEGLDMAPAPNATVQDAWERIMHNFQDLAVACPHGSLSDQYGRAMDALNVAEFMDAVEAEGYDVKNAEERKDISDLEAERDANR